MAQFRKAVPEFIRCHTRFFLEQPGKVRRIFKAQLVSNFGNAAIAAMTGF